MFFVILRKKYYGFESRVKHISNKQNNVVFEEFIGVRESCMRVNEKALRKTSSAS